MLIDTDSLVAGDALSADLCIVGAGAAGISMARALAHSSLKVLLLEGGGFDPSGASQALYVGKVRHPERLSSYLGSSRLRFFGGATNHWAGWCRPLEPEVFEEREWIPHSGWPITRSDLNPWYDLACDVVQIRRFPPDETPVAVKPKLLRTDPDRLLTRFFHFSPPTRFGQEYRDEIVTAENVDLVLDANVLRIRCDANAKTVQHLELRTMDGRPFTATARAVVLAAGGIENARLLLLSDSEQPGGLGNGNDLVGRFFCDHPHIQADHGWLAPDVGEYLDANRDTRTRAALVLPAEVLKREQILFGSLHLDRFDAKRPLPLQDGVSQLVSATWRPKKARRKNPRGGLYRARLMTEPAPNPDSRLELGSDLDAFGQRRVEMSWRLSELDAKTLERMRVLMADELGRILAGRFHFTDGGWARNVIAGQHHMGATRMADDPIRGVVDANCRVHGVDNLWIAGSSVFPICGYANPTLTLVALALRLADHLKQELTS